MKTLSNTEAELKKALLMKKPCIRRALSRWSSIMKIGSYSEETFIKMLFFVTYKELFIRQADSNSRLVFPQSVNLLTVNLFLGEEVSIRQKKYFDTRTSIPMRVMTQM